MWSQLCVVSWSCAWACGLCGGDHILVEECAEYSVYMKLYFLHVPARCVNSALLGVLWWSSSSYHPVFLGILLVLGYFLDIVIIKFRVWKQVVHIVNIDLFLISVWCLTSSSQFFESMLQIYKHISFIFIQKCKITYTLMHFTKMDLE